MTLRARMAFSIYTHWNGGYRKYNSRIPWREVSYHPPRQVHRPLTPAVRMFKLVKKRVLFGCAMAMSLAEFGAGVAFGIRYDWIMPQCILTDHSRRMWMMKE